MGSTTTTDKTPKWQVSGRRYHKIVAGSMELIVLKSAYAGYHWRVTNGSETIAKGQTSKLADARNECLVAYENHKANPDNCASWRECGKSLLRFLKDEPGWFTNWFHDHCRG